jgi:micrococcal nuclease
MPSSAPPTYLAAISYAATLGVIPTSVLVMLAAVLGASPAAAANPLLEMCNGRPNTPDKTCLVDGDTLWLYGENIRLKDFDTPEPQTQICGGAAEIALAQQASARLLDILNKHEWTIERFEYDSTASRRRLATIRIDGRDVGQILIEEGLARAWPDGEEWWCH